MLSLTQSLFSAVLSNPNESIASGPYSVNMWSSENQGQKMREMREKQTLSEYIPTVFNFQTTSRKCEMILFVEI